MSYPAFGSTALPSGHFVVESLRPTSKSASSAEQIQLRQMNRELARRLNVIAAEQRNEKEKKEEKDGKAETEKQ